MKNIQDKIESLKVQIKELKEKHQLSFDSVKKERGSGYYNSLTDTCLQVLCLLEGEVFKPYGYGWCSRFNLSQGSTWENGGFTYYQYSCIYSKQTGGSPIGVVSTKEELFRAVGGEYKFKDIWKKRVSECSSELRGFGEFCDAVKKDHNFLLKCVCEYYKINFQVYKNRTLKIPELYVIMYEKKYENVW